MKHTIKNKLPTVLFSLALFAASANARLSCISVGDAASFNSISLQARVATNQSLSGVVVVGVRANGATELVSQEEQLDTFNQGSSYLVNLLPKGWVEASLSLPISFLETEQFDATLNYAEFDGDWRRDSTIKMSCNLR
jgi:hypothetical protein